MEITKTITFCCMLALCSLVLSGCGEKADVNKPLSEVKAEAEKMGTGQLKSIAMKYKDAIMAKKDVVEEVAAKLKGIPVAEKLGAESKDLIAEMEALTNSVSALQKRFQVYYQKLKEKGGDLSGLEF